MGAAKVGHAKAETKTSLRPIVGLTEGLSKPVLEAIVVEAILKHRYLRDLAELRQGEAQRCLLHGDSNGAAQLACVRAMIDAHAQQAVLSALLDVLGYIPSVPTDQ